MPELRRRDRSEEVLSGEIESLDLNLANEETYLKLTENLDSFLGRLRDAATNSSVRERQQVVRLVVREVLVDTDSVIIRHTIPGLNPGGMSSCHLWGVSRCGDSSSGSDPENSGLPRDTFPGATDCSRVRGCGGLEVF
jgi:hypothetical protein